MTPTALERALPVGGSASIAYADPFNPGRKLVLECHRPANHAPDRPVVIVQHGMNRNGSEYRDAWVPTADRHGLLIVAITFPSGEWPGSNPYNNGLVRADDGSVRPPEAWTYAIPGRIFVLLRAAGITTRDKAYLWGHSAGSQFVHRLLATQPHGLFEAVGTANAGWYSLPTLERAFPDGLGGIGLAPNDIERFFAYPLTIFAGDRDIDSTADNLPKHDAAMAQGPHRFARAHHFLKQGRAEATARGVACNWRLVVVPGVGHEGMRMSAFSAAYWFENEGQHSTAR
ncbi:MAG TPA: alpha/beta hydrolase [Acetobacteraceae bacterium]|jgi:poly(3-hydroxybutyrate) depolymerase|nr:alpha/beta hydrolase [Acetobacteraceae bacterium]